MDIKPPRAPVAPTTARAPRKLGLGLQSILLVVLLVAPVPGYLAAQAHLDWIAGGIIVVLALVMLFIVRRA
mgnify:CR=1 FL=1